MEPNEFDNWIKGKAKEDSALYEKEIEASRPRVWESIQEELPQTKKNTRWFYWAAAAILFFISLGAFLFDQMDDQHNREMDLLKAELEELKSRDDQRSNQVKQRDEELIELKEELADLLEELKNSEIEEKEANYLVRQVIQRDTIYIRSIEYKESSPITDEIEAGEEMADINNKKLEVGSETIPNEEGVDQKIETIYPSKTKRNSNQKNQSALTLKVGPFSSQ